MKLLIKIFFLTFVLLFAINSYGQFGDKMILLTKINKDKSLNNSRHVKLRIGNNVCLKFKSDSIIRGRIEKITDSTISIKGLDFSLKNIFRINKTGTGTLLTAGLSITTLAYGSYYILINSENAPLGYSIFSFVFIPIGAVTAIAGVIVDVTWKRFYLGKNWKISVTADDMIK
jgi:hypothetical protein